MATDYTDSNSRSIFPDLGVDALKAGPPTGLRWLAFIGWLILPILATWGVVVVTSLAVLWWGFVWTGFALVYMIVYFRWAKRRYPAK